MIRLYTSGCRTEYSEHDSGVMLALHALRQCFGEVCPELFSRGDILRYAETGKPYVGVGSGMYVSISHSHGLCAAAVSDGEVGVDIEYIDPNRPAERLKRLAERFFSADELAYIKAGDDAGDAVLPERFFEVWCAKESYVKYTGDGLSGLGGFSIFGLPVNVTRLRVIDTNGGSYACAVASRERAEISPIYVEPCRIV